MITPFAALIMDALEKRPHSHLSTHMIAQQVFPGKWSRRKGRGALVGHIDRAASKLPNVHRIVGSDRFCPPSFVYLPPQLSTA